jgi:hypothetical protein
MSESGRPLQARKLQRRITAEMVDAPPQASRTTRFGVSVDPSPVGNGRKAHHMACSAHQTVQAVFTKKFAEIPGTAKGAFCHPLRDWRQRGFAIRILTTWTGGGSLAFSALRAKVRAWRFLTAAADISGSLGIRSSLNNTPLLRVEYGQKMASGRIAGLSWASSAKEAGKARNYTVDRR